MAITYSLLSKQNAETSNALIEDYTNSSDFATLSKKEGDAILARDQEDADKLQVGIDYAKDKGVIDPKYVPEPYVEIDVLGKTPDSVANEIIDRADKHKSDGAGNDAGSVIVLCGLSGTGKGTTVAKLSEKLSADNKVVCWSNGNIFRSVTLLAATWCEQNLPQEENGKLNFDASKALTKENLETFMKMLSFGKFNNKFDTKIQGLGLEYLISEVQNTVLKSPKVSKNIPTVAEVTQGEVIHFAAKAIEIMSQDGISILLEGREQTVNYVRTPLRFTLTLSDESLIGKRRAAQRLMAAALAVTDENVSEAGVKEALDAELAKMLANES
jgi:cytidylate kinase